MRNDVPLKNLTPDTKLSEIISINGEAKALLDSIGLNPLDHQDETLRSVCQQKKWSEVEVLEWVKKHSNGLQENDRPDLDKSAPNSSDQLTEWADYLEEQFINPVTNVLNEIDSNFPRVHKIHGNQYPWLKNMQWYYDKFSKGLRMFYKFEEKKFLPVVKALQNGRATTITHGTTQKLEKCFQIIERDHDRLSRLLKTIRKKGNSFENPELACSTLCIMNENFKALEEKLKEQFEFETKQLLPRVKQELSNKR